VLAMAGQRAGALSVNEVLLNRLGKRTWGGIGLATALVVSMGLLSANPIETSASDGARRSSVAKSDATQPPKQQGQLAKHTARSPGVFADQPNANPDSLDPSRSTETGSDGKANDNTGAATANPDGTGGGAGRSKPKDASTSSPERSGTNGPPDSTGNTTASGGASGTNAGNEGATGQSVGRSAAPAAASPWTSPTWGRSRDAAESALRDGAIPAEYHDLIRAYFDRR
jgi:hypothetical protein